MDDEAISMKMDNRKYIRYSMVMLDLPPIDIAKPEAVEKRGQWYFNHCLENGLVPGVVGLCLALGIDRRTFSGWVSGAHRSRTHTEIARKFKTLLENLTESRMIEGQLSPTVGIFMLKNHYGYQDQCELAIEQNNEQTPSADEIWQRYI